MRCELNDLRERVVLSAQIFDALASKRQVQTILQGLEEQQDLSTIVRSINSAPRPQFGTNSLLKSVEGTAPTEEPRKWK